MKKLLAILPVALLFFCISAKVEASTYTSSFAPLTSVSSSTNFTNPTNASLLDSSVATNSASTYEIDLRTPDITTLALPSDAVITGAGVNIQGTGSGGSIRVTLTNNSVRCQSLGSLPDSGTTFSTTNTAIFQNTTFPATVSGGCNNGGYSNPTAASVANIGVDINNGASGTTNPIGIQNVYVFVSYTSVSKDSLAAITSTTQSLKQVCGLLDVWCNFENFLSDLFNFFFGFNPTYASTNFTSVQTAFNSKIPFAYTTAVFNINYSGIATDSAVPSFTLPIASTPATTTSLYSIPSLPSHSYTTTDSGGAIQGLLTQVRSVETIALYLLLLPYGLVIYRRFTGDS